MLRKYKKKKKTKKLCAIFTKQCGGFMVEGEKQGEGGNGEKAKGFGMYILFLKIWSPPLSLDSISLATFRLTISTSGY